MTRGVTCHPERSEGPPAFRGIPRRLAPRNDSFLRIRLSPMPLPDRFVKMAGGGNDFLLFEADGRSLGEADSRRISLLCRRGLSVGADGALFMSGGGDGRGDVTYSNADCGLTIFST